MLVRKFPSIQIQFIDLPPKPVKASTPNIPGSLSDIDPEPNTNFDDNSSLQEGVISET